MAHACWSKQLGVNVSVLEPYLNPADQLSRVHVDNLFISNKRLAIVFRPTTDNPRYPLVESLVCVGGSGVGVVLERGDICVGVGCAVFECHVLKLKWHCVARDRALVALAGTKSFKPSVQSDHSGGCGFR